MSETWFKTYRWRNGIEAVQVERHTDASVWMKGRKRARSGQYENYFQSWDDARNYLMDRAESHVLSLKRQLESAQGELGNVKGMKAP